MINDFIPALARRINKDLREKSAIRQSDSPSKQAETSENEAPEPQDIETKDDDSDDDAISDSDQEDNEEQGTLRFGVRKQIAAYEDEDSENEDMNTSENKGQNGETEHDTSTVARADFGEADGDLSSQQSGVSKFDIPGSIVSNDFVEDEDEDAQSDIRDDPDYSSANLFNGKLLRS